MFSRISITFSAARQDAVSPMAVILRLVFLSNIGLDIVRSFRRGISDKTRRMVNRKKFRLSLSSLKFQPNVYFSF